MPLLLAVCFAVYCGVVLVSLPMYHDHAIYWRGGQTLWEGRKLSNDMLVKQPGIYILFATAHLLFGNHEWSYRLLDLVIQLITTITLVIIIRRVHNWGTGLLAGVLYLALYTSNGYVLAAHPESYIALAIALMALLRIRPQWRWWYAMFDGVILAVIVSMKVTLGIITLGLLLYDYLDKSRRGFIVSHWVVAILTATGVLIVESIMLWSQIDWQSIPLVIEYLRFYASLPPLTVDSVIVAWKRILDFVSERITIVCTAAAIAALIPALHPKPSQRNGSLLWSTLFLVTAFSLVIERKFGVVHMERLFVFASVGAAVILHNTFIRIASWWNTVDSERKILIALPTAVLTIMLSPLPRLAMLGQVPFYAVTNDIRYNAFFHRPAHNVFHRQTLIESTDFLRRHMHANDRVLLLSACMSQLYVLLDQPLWNHFSTTLPIFAKHVPEPWLQLYKHDLHVADWLIVSTLDRAPELLGHNRTSFESLWSDTTSAIYVQAHFEEVMRTDIAIIYRRIRL